MVDNAIGSVVGAWVARNRAQLRLSLRLTLAGLLTFGIGHVLGLPQLSWAVLTALIVTQASVGGAIKAALDRFFGSLGGAVWGVAVSLTLSHTDPWSVALMLAVALAPLALLTALRPAYRIAPVTAVIILLAPVGQAGGPLASAINRMLEIGVGSVVALGVAFLVLPERAYGVLARTAAQGLDAMAELAAALLAGLAAPRDSALVDELNARIRKTVIAAETVADEVSRERRFSLAAAIDPEPLCRTLRRLHNDLTMIGRASLAPFPEPVRSALAEPASDAAAAIGAFLRESGQAILGQAPAPKAETLEQKLDAYAAAVADLRHGGLTRSLPDEAVGRVFGLTFALEQLRPDLADLAGRIREVAEDT